ncbi:hypothetical protein M569_10878, partial [Genlisea aurea]
MATTASGLIDSSGKSSSSSSAHFVSSMAAGESVVPKFRSLHPPPLSSSTSSWFAIPPGISPTEFLDSPVLLSASN